MTAPDILRRAFPACGRNIAAPPLQALGELPPGRDGATLLARQTLRRRGTAFATEAASRDADLALRAFCKAGRTAFGAALHAEAASGRRLLVFGDYDADGMCAAASMVAALAAARGMSRGDSPPPGLNPVDAAAAVGIHVTVPERRDGYGIKPPSIDRAAAAGIHTIIACDNGSNAIAALDRARGLGIAVLVIDHHPLTISAEAWWSESRRALLWNPMTDGQAEQAMRHAQCGREACASMLVDLVAAELLDRCRRGATHHHGAVLAGIATVTDVMPARDANRAAVRTALRRLGSGDCPPGLRRLTREHLTRSKVIPEPDFDGADRSDALDEEFIGFELGPRLNACGRTGDAALGVKLLMSEADQAVETAALVDTANRTRKAAQERAWLTVAPLVAAVTGQRSKLWDLVAEDDAAAEAQNSLALIRSPDRKSLIALVPGVAAVICSTAGDEGLAGLLAERATRELGCPALYCAIKPTAGATTMLIGSGRVPRNSPLLAISTGAVATEVFNACGGDAGGHSAAFGARIQAPSHEERFARAVALLTIRTAAGLARALRNLGREELTRLLAAERDDATRCDAAVTLGSLRPSLAAAVRSLGPFGPGFEKPRFLVDLPPSGIRPMGARGSFMIDAGQGRSGVRLIGFARDFEGGAPVLSANGAAERMAAEGCAATGFLKSSYYGWGESGAAWRGPWAELVIDGLARRQGEPVDAI